MVLCLSLPQGIFRAENRSCLKSKAFIKLPSSLKEGCLGIPQVEGRERPWRASGEKRDDSGGKRLSREGFEGHEREGGRER